MALFIAAVCILFSLLLRPSFSAPVSLDENTVQLSNSENQFTEKTPVFNTETIFNLEKEMKLVQSLSTDTVLNAFESVKADHSKRIKRNIVTQGFCPRGWVQVGNGCVTQEKYDESNGVGEDSYDDVAEE